MTATLWIAWPKRKPEAKLRLFCLPHAGGGASTYGLWANAIHPEVELCPIQLPGRENRLRERPFTRLDDLIQALAEALQLGFDLPFALFGHSMGALVGFELARFLRRERGISPMHLFVSGRRAPHLPDRSKPLHRLPDPAFAWELRLRHAGIPDIIFQDKELMQIFLPTIRADLAVVETHVYTDDRPLSCPISAYGGEEDHWATYELLAGWEQHTCADFRLKMFPGNHFFPQSARPLVLEAINHELAQTLGKLKGIHSTC